jgi:hypothetical protein
MFMRCRSFVFNNLYFAEECLQFEVRLFHYRPELLKGLSKKTIPSGFEKQNYYEKRPNEAWDSYVDRKVIISIYCFFTDYNPKSV